MKVSIICSLCRLSINNSSSCCFWSADALAACRHSWSCQVLCISTQLAIPPSIESSLCVRYHAQLSLLATKFQVLWFFHLIASLLVDKSAAAAKSWQSEYICARVGDRRTELASNKHSKLSGDRCQSLKATSIASLEIDVRMNLQLELMK